MKETALSATWGPRHKFADSVDTNVSDRAESTITIGQIIKFPEPPSSIPNSPAASTFAAARQLPRAPRLQEPAPLHLRKLPLPPASFINHVNPSHSFVNPHTTSI